MSSEPTPITSRAELRAALQMVLLRADEMGIDVKGGFDCRNGGDRPDWDVLITEVEKNGDST